MRYAEWERVEFLRSEFDLLHIWAFFEKDEDAVWYIDRHVFEVDQPSFSDASLQQAGCWAGLALLRKWLRQKSRLGRQQPLTSDPFLAISDEWLRGVEGAEPPHVYLCLAKEPKELRPVRYDASSMPSAPGYSILAPLITSGETLLRAQADDVEEPGGLWIVKRCFDKARQGFSSPR